MKFISIILGLLLLIGCGGGEKKTQEITPPPSPQYTYQTPTQDMLDSGEKIFDKSCFICHENDAGEVKMLADKLYWTENRAKDFEILVQHVHDGYTGDFGTMTPMGSCIDCSKEDLQNAIFYMMTKAGVLE